MNTLTTQTPTEAEHAKVMDIQRWRRMSGFLLLMSILAACATNAPTPTPPPDATKTIRASDGETGIIRVEYPAQWVAIEQGDHSINIANSGFAMRSYDIDMTELQSGHIAGTVSALTKDAIPNVIDSNVQGIVQYIVRTVSDGQQTRYTFGSVQTMTQDGIQIAYSDGFGTEPDSDAALAVRILVADADEAYGIAFFGAPFGELEPALPQLNAIAASFMFEPLPTDDS